MLFTRKIGKSPVDSRVCFVNTYLLDSDLSSGYIQTTEARCIPTVCSKLDNFFDNNITVCG